jgi:hypothetical protein
MTVTGGGCREIPNTVGVACKERIVTDSCFHSMTVTYTTFRNLLDKTILEIRKLENEYVLKASPTELEQYYLQKILLQPLVLHANELQIEDRQGINFEVTHDFRRGVFPGERAFVRGTRLTVVIPFEGDQNLWRVRASTYTIGGGRPEITIQDGTIAFGVDFADDTANAEQIRHRIDQDTRSLSEAVNYLKNDVDQHNRTAADTIRQELDQKRKQAQATTGVLANLGIPIKQKNEPPAFAVPVKRREQPIRRPAVAAGKYEAEPFLEEKEYDYILNVLRSMSLVIERDPTAFATLDEEGIRTHFLLQLNGHYEGGASGETFNRSGKTDILIRSGDRNVFIAECKFWRGSKGFSEAIDQLLSYLTWRDTKCALLIFNTTKDSGGVRTKMHQVMQARPEYKKTVFHNPDGDSRYILIKPSEPGKEIIVTTQLYDVPTNN